PKVPAVGPSGVRIAASRSQSRCNFRYDALGAGEVMLRSSRTGPWVMAMMRLSAFAAAVAVALLAAPACAQVRWSLPSAYPADNFHSENLDAFAQEVAEATSGKLAIKTYPNASLFPATAIKSAVRIGPAQ